MLRPHTIVAALATGATAAALLTGCASEQSYSRAPVSCATPTRTPAAVARTPCRCQKN